MTDRLKERLSEPCFFKIRFKKRGGGMRCSKKWERELLNILTEKQYIIKERKRKKIRKKLEIFTSGEKANYG